MITLIQFFVIDVIRRFIRHLNLKLIPKWNHMSQFVIQTDPAIIVLFIKNTYKIIYQKDL